MMIIFALFTSSAATALAFLNSTRIFPFGGAAWIIIIIILSAYLQQSNTNIHDNINAETNA